MTSAGNSKLARPLISLLAGAILACPAYAQENSENRDSAGRWQWSVAPYVWLVDTKVDLTARGLPIGGGQVSFSDLIDSADTALQIVTETGKEGTKWSGFVDLTYLKASETVTSDVPNNPDGLEIKSRSEQIYIDAALAYWPFGHEEGFNLYGGIRYTKLDDKFDFSLLGSPIGTLDSSRGYTDALLGLRYFITFSPVWALATRADYGFGDSEGIVMCEALLRYAVGRSRQHGVLAGYRYKKAEFQERDIIREEFRYNGPVVAFEFRF